MTNVGKSILPTCSDGERGILNITLNIRNGSDAGVRRIRRSSLNIIGGLLSDLGHAIIPIRKGAPSKSLTVRNGDATTLPIIETISVNGHVCTEPTNSVLRTKSFSPSALEWKARVNYAVTWVRCRWTMIIRRANSVACSVVRATTFSGMLVTDSTSYERALSI